MADRLRKTLANFDLDRGRIQMAKAEICGYLILNRTKPMRNCLIISLCIFATCSHQIEASNDGSSTEVDRTTQSPLMEWLPEDKLSSGAFSMLATGSPLIRESDLSVARQQSAASIISLDPRVGFNIRLGEDPEALLTNHHQAEPHIIRSWHNPDVLLGTFQSGRLVDGGAVGCGYALSHDGGSTWERGLIPGLTRRSGGVYFRATDPVAGVGPDGILYINTLAAATNDFSEGELVLSRSTDNGVSWNQPSTVYRPSSPEDEFPDKNWMAVNDMPGTFSTGRIVVTYTSFQTDRHPIYSTYSEDGGSNWSAPVRITGENDSNQGSQVFFFPDGTLGVIYYDFETSDFHFITSSNAGVNYGSPVKIADVVLWDDPQLRDGAFLPSATADRTNGHIFMVYQAQGEWGIPKIMFTKSTDKGVRWSTPVPINSTPPGVSVVNPAVSISPDGQHVVVVYYDKQNAPQESRSMFVDLYMVESFDSGATWSDGLRITEESSDIRYAQRSEASDGTFRGYMLGDYQAVAAPSGQTIPAVPIWVDTRTTSPDPFVTRISPSADFGYTSFLSLNYSQEQLANDQLADPSNDFDGDGFSNLIEFALMTDLETPDSESPLQYQATESGLAFTYDTYPTSPPLLFWERSMDLENWSPATPDSSDRVQQTVTDTFLFENESTFYRLIISE